MKKLTIIATMAALLATVGLATLGAVTLASAQETETNGRIANLCTGSLHAQGDGMVIVGGKGSVSLSATGTLWVMDRGGDAEVTVSDYQNEETFNDGWTQYSGFEGSAAIEGSRIIVVIAGTGIDLHAEGCGRARLWGHGTFDVNGRTGQWGPVMARGISFTNWLGNAS